MIAEGAAEQGVVAAICDDCTNAPEITSMLDTMACDANEHQAPALGRDMMEQFFVRRPNAKELDALTAQVHDAVKKVGCDPTTKRCAAIDFLISKA